MVETPREIEAHIDRTRERLGSHLKELGDKVDAATDWQEHYRAHPHLFLGAAFAGGAALALAMHGRAPRDYPGDGHSSFVAADGSAQAQVLELWDTIKGALIGVASVRVMDFLAELIPGFDEQYQQSAQRTARRLS